MATVATARLEEMRVTFSGSILEPTDSGYEEARRVHNAMIDRRPALIAQCRNTADIVDAVRSPIGKRSGALASLRADELAGQDFPEPGPLLRLGL